MKIEIWSDVMCPFCYIGKRKFEAALAGFEHKEDVKVTWKSFQLNPNLVQKPGQTLYSYMAEHKGWTEEYAKQATGHVNNMAKEVGLAFNFDTSIPANTFHAHRLIHLAAKHGLQDKAEEQLFNAHFMQGKDVGNTATLTSIGLEMGLPQEALTQLFSSNAFVDEVEVDMAEAQQLGAHGVPFFVIDRKYAVSGAQPSDVFTQVLEKAWSEAQPGETSDGMSCSVDGECN